MKQANLNTLLTGGGILVTGVVLGIAVGAISGLLLAPQSGEETRKQIRNEADEIAGAIKNKGEEILNAGKHQVSKVLQQTEKVV